MGLEKLEPVGVWVKKKCATLQTMKQNFHNACGTPTNLKLNISQQNIVSKNVSMR